METLYKNMLIEVINGNISKPRGQVISEVINFSVKIDNIINCGFEYPSRKFQYKYLAAELIWYLSGDLKTENIGQYANLWNIISDENLEAKSNYGYLVFDKPIENFEQKSQFDWCLNSLIKDKDSRQAIIRYNHEGVQKEGEKDFICTMFQQFFIRNDTLICITNMRSNDLFYGFSYDIIWFSLVMQSLHLELKEFYTNIKLGQMYFNASSAHIYEKMFEKTNKIITEKGISIDFKLKESLRKNKNKINYNKIWEKLKNENNYKKFIENNFNIKIDKKGD